METDDLIPQPLSLSVVPEPTQPGWMAAQRPWKLLRWLAPEKPIRLLENAEREGVYLVGLQLLGHRSGSLLCEPIKPCNIRADV